MEVLARLVDVIPEATRTPLSLLAFLAIVVAVVVLGVRSRKLSGIHHNLKDLPEKDRLRALEQQIGEPLPKGMTANQWIRFQTKKYYFFGFLCTLAFILVALVIAVPPRPAPIEKPSPITIPIDKKGMLEEAALAAMQLVHSRKDDSALFDMFVDSAKSNYGTLARFKSELDRNTAQLVEKPVQRRKVTADATDSQGMVFFDAETDSGMIWREQVSMVMVDGNWRLTGFFFFPAVMAGAMAQNADPTLKRFLRNVEDSTEPVVAVIPMSGWNVRTEGQPVPKAGLRCDLEVTSEGKRALIEDAYGACNIPSGTEISILGLINYTSTEVVIRNVTFVPTRKFP